MSESEYVRVTIDVPEDTLRTLDQMKDFAGYASRGRTIQALVDAIAEMGVDSQGMNQTVTTFQQDIARLKLASPAEQWQSLLIFLTQYGAWAGSITRRLSRFVKIA